MILIELVKRRVGELHQINEISSTEIVDEFEPQIEGLEKLEQKRRVTCLDCVLSKDLLDENNVGYQKPEPKEDRPQRTLEPRKEYQPNPNRGGRGRGQREDRPQRRFNDTYEPRGDRPTPVEGGERPFRGRGGRPQGFSRDDNDVRRDRDAPLREGGFRGAPRGGFRGGRGGFQNRDRD